MRFSRRTALALIAMVVVVASVVGVVWRIHSSKHPVDTATVMAGDLAAVAVAVTLLMALGAWWWKGRTGPPAQVSSAQVAAAADRLAELMAGRWRLEATRRRIITPAPATVRWRWAADEVTAPRLEVTTLPLPGTGPPPLPDLGRPGELLGSGVVTRLHDEVYARLPHGRLVLLGGPGAGKTGAMILLLLAALDSRASLTGDQRDQVPVPVWLTLGGWDPATTSLHDWTVATTNRDYPPLRARDYGPDAVGELLSRSRVALFLDGLDEMPEGARAQALKRIGDEAKGLRSVITSRPEEYRHALQAGQPDNTAVIELRPIRPEAAAVYLLHGQAGPSRQRWKQVGAYLTHNPDSVVARALDNPLNLSLARDTYTNQDPAVLIDPSRFPTAEAVREHLIDQFLITAYPNERQRAHAIGWLTWIAYHMGTSQDLPWWDIPSWILRRPRRLTRGLAVGLLVGLVAGRLVVARLGLGEPRTLVPRRPRPSELGQFFATGDLAVSVAILTVVLAAGHRLPGVLVLVLVLVLAAWLAARFAFWLLSLWATPIADSPSATAAGTYRAARRASMIYGFALGLAAGLAAGLTAGLTAGLAAGLLVGLVAGLPVGFASALVSGPVPLVKMTELVLARQQRRRVHFLHLLEDASGRQVLRQAGTVYQFRHAALQAHLAAMST
jgi:hypothetical protein